MRAFIRTIATLCMATCSVAVAADELESLFLGGHSPRTAFYERAPGRLSAAMRKAVSSICRDSPVEPRPAWLCDGSSLSFLREVYVTGSKSSNGFVCRSDEMSGLRYYTPDMFTEVDPQDAPRCLPVICDGETGLHEVVLPVAPPP